MYPDSVTHELFSERQHPSAGIFHVKRCPAGYAVYRADPVRAVLGEFASYKEASDFCRSLSVLKPT